MKFILLTILCLPCFAQSTRVRCERVENGATITSHGTATRFDGKWVTCSHVVEKAETVFVESCGSWIRCDGVASDYIRDACAATAAEWPDIPKQGMITFIDPLHVAARKIRGRSAIGYSYFEAGFTHVGYTKAGLWAMQLSPENFPEPCEAHRSMPVTLFD